MKKKTFSVWLKRRCHFPQIITITLFNKDDIYHHLVPLYSRLYLLVWSFFAITLAYVIISIVMFTTVYHDNIMSISLDVIITGNMLDLLSSHIYKLELSRPVVYLNTKYKTL